MDSSSSRAGRSVSPWRVAWEWTRIGVTGFGGPPAHIALLRRLMVDRTGWMSADEFQDANAACGLLPGPASTQMAMFCAYRVAGRAGVVVGGLGFVVPAVTLVLVLSLLFLGHDPPLWVRGAGGGAGAAVAAVAVAAGRMFVAPSLARIGPRRSRRARWLAYVIVAGVVTVLAGPYLVLGLLGCGAVEVSLCRPAGAATVVLPWVAAVPGRLTALAWTALKVGALSFGGGFVIIPLMQGDAVHAHHWMTNARFLNAVALGQVTPGPVVATVAAVGYAVHGVTGGLLAAGVAFAPSFAFVLIGGPRFARLRTNRTAQAFLDGAGPAAIGAIFGAAVVLARTLHGWQLPLLALAAVAVLLARRGIVATLVGAGLIGVIIVLAGGGLPR